MRQVIKVIEIDPTEKPEQVEANIAVLWESMITDDKVKPAIVGIHRLTMGLVAFVFDYSWDCGASFFDAASLVPEDAAYAPTDGGNRPEHSVGGGPRRELPSLRGAVRS
jgi:hypothetical protein